MFGKHFCSMYTGSMIGSGCVVFAVMGYVIAHAVPDEQVGAQVELNPVLLALIFGESEEKVQKAIDFLCSPDPRSRSKEEGGRRLVRLGEYAYRVVNGPKYLAMRDREQQRKSARERKRKERARKKIAKEDQVQFTPAGIPIQHPMPGEPSASGGGVGFEEEAETK